MILSETVYNSILFRIFTSISSNYLSTTTFKTIFSSVSIYTFIWSEIQACHRSLRLNRSRITHAWMIWNTGCRKLLILYWNLCLNVNEWLTWNTCLSQIISALLCFHNLSFNAHTHIGIIVSGRQLYAHTQWNNCLGCSCMHTE